MMARLRRQPNPLCCVTFSYQVDSLARAPQATPCSRGVSLFPLVPQWPRTQSVFFVSRVSLREYATGMGLRPLFDSLLHSHVRRPVATRPPPHVSHSAFMHSQMKNKTPQSIFVSSDWALCAPVRC